MNRAIFLDRDGVISKAVKRNGRYRAPLNFKEFNLLPGVSESIRRLKSMKFLCIVITNQPEVGSGEILSKELSKMHEFLLNSLEIDDIFACTHLKEENCFCRKPKPGLIHAACEKWDINPAKSYMIGDRFSDIEAGKNAGCTTILVISEAALEEKSELNVKTFLAISLDKATRLIEYFKAGDAR